MREELKKYHSHAAGGCDARLLHALCGICHHGAGHSPVEDGLKPVRGIFSIPCTRCRVLPTGSHKNAPALGDTMGKYHPHGDTSIYDALARMAQDFSMNVPLIDGQGNFGSIDGDGPAAMRYTEARLAPLPLKCCGIWIRIPFPSS